MTDIVKRLREECIYVDAFEAADEIERMRQEIALLEAKLRYAYLECEQDIKYWDYENELKVTDVAGMILHMSYMIQAKRLTVINDEMYARINKNDKAWRKMLSERKALESEDCEEWDD